ncbi:phosphopantothenoylcysteine decarboxylase subunit VHS3-like [Cucumis melo var. makuwa]|uniref:Phosphopantothenoylcysteine decarboxylase subunit VHS3-like n=1 Tax=Cucumis melo var. makuwa TaxID=1194695 RepID=A0A5D3D493_CUCMM|nr:phosphopantothenoylcysteine decarboxylase subunit VHS3-like [Cucumis melo var. makuwa]
MERRLSELEDGKSLTTPTYRQQYMEEDDPIDFDNSEDAKHDLINFDSTEDEDDDPIYFDYTEDEDDDLIGCDLFEDEDDDRLGCATLKMEMTIHEDDDLFYCAALKMKMMIHIGEDEDEDPLSCNICEKMKMMILLVATHGKILVYNISESSRVRWLTFWRRGEATP